MTVSAPETPICGWCGVHPVADLEGGHTCLICLDEFGGTAQRPGPWPEPTVHWINIIPPADQVDEE